MRRITTEFLSQDTLDKLDFKEFVRYGGEKEKIIKKLNEFYQYCPNCFVGTNKGNYNYLQDIVDKKVYLLKYFN